MLVEADWKKILLGKYYFPANFYFACCESQGFWFCWLVVYSVSLVLT